MSVAGLAAGPSVLLVEDDDDTRAILRRELTSRGYRVEEAVDARSAVRRWEQRRPDLVVLDLGLPDLDGMSVVRRIRREASTPILILSAQHEERQKVEALELGADDYVTKPFGLAELDARIRVALRHGAGAAAGADGLLRVGPVELDPIRHEVRASGSQVDLTPREFETLRVLLANPGRLVTKARLLRAVWGEAYQREDAYVYVHVSQLRRKLADADPSGRSASIIGTEPGVGYRVREPDHEASATPTPSS